MVSPPAFDTWSSLHLIKGLRDYVMINKQELAASPLVRHNVSFRRQGRRVPVLNPHPHHPLLLLFSD